MRNGFGRLTLLLPAIDHLQTRATLRSTLRAALATRHPGRMGAGSDALKGKQ